MDTAKEMWKMIMGNLALIQVPDPLKTEILFTYRLTYMHVCSYRVEIMKGLDSVFLLFSCIFWK